MIAKTKRYSKRIERNLLAAYERASAADLNEGINWYQTAHEACKALAGKHGLTLKQSCGIVAALSPGRQWEFNISDAEILIASYLKGNRGKYLPIVGVYGRRNVIKSIAILEGKEPLNVLGGNKVRSFYGNLLDPSSELSVTIDRHAKCCAYGIKSTEMSLVRDSEYEYLAEHFRVAAAKLDLSPCQFQATVWVVWRRLDGVLAQADLFEDSEVPSWVESGLAAV